VTRTPQTHADLTCCHLRKSYWVTLLFRHCSRRYEAYGKIEMLPMGKLTLRELGTK
jgi:hypothetical protein